MRPLTPDDLLPLEEFAGQRRQHFEAHVRYVDRYRRVRLGPRLTLVFENRQTLWFRVQEVLRVARLADPARILEELAVYNRLLPGRGRLQAALTRPLGRIHLAGDYLGTWYTETAAQTAEAAARAVRDELGR